MTMKKQVTDEHLAYELLMMESVVVVEVVDSAGVGGLRGQEDFG